MLDYSILVSMQLLIVGKGHYKASGMGHFFVSLYLITFKITSKPLLGYTKQLFTKVEVNSGGFMPSCKVLM